jgi:hypothetical protein
VNAVRVFLTALIMTTSAMANQFTYTFQLAGYAFDRCDQMGAIDYLTFVTVFDRFPWAEQLKQRATIDEGCSATISVTDSERHLDYWVSVAGEERKPVFLLGITYDKEVKGFLAFGKSRKTRWVEIYVAPSRESILNTFRLFFAGEKDQLFQMLRSFEAFDEMEAWRPPKA